MHVEVNGEDRQLPDPLTVRGLLEHLELTGRRVAVAINACVVPRSRFDVAVISDGDCIEVIQAVGGG